MLTKKQIKSLKKGDCLYTININKEDYSIVKLTIEDICTDEVNNYLSENKIIGGGKFIVRFANPDDFWFTGYCNGYKYVTLLDYNFSIYKYYCENLFFTIEDIKKLLSKKIDKLNEKIKELELDIEEHKTIINIINKQLNNNNYEK